MLKDSYFKIVNIEDGDTTKYSVELNPQHDVYNGHFPGEPVCPGVCSVQMIRECIEDKLGKKLSLSNLGQVRFTSLITPNANPNLVVSFTASETEEGTYKVKADITAGETSFLSLKGELKVK